MLSGLASHGGPARTRLGNGTFAQSHELGCGAACWLLAKSAGCWERLLQGLGVPCLIAGQGHGYQELGVCLKSSYNAPSRAPEG